MEDEQTRIMTLTGAPTLAADERIHFVELVHGLDGRRHVVNGAGATIGRKPPADIVLSDSEISRAHCQLSVHQDQL